MGSNYRKIRLFKKINKSSEEFEENFGILNQQKHFIIVYQQKLMIPMAVVFQDAMESLLKKNLKII